MVITVQGLTAQRFAIIVVKPYMLISSGKITNLKNFKYLKNSKLLPYHEKVSVHMAEVIYLLLKEGVRNKASPGSSPDLMPIKNAFA